MKVALVNPPWSFEGSIYFGCREPHLPLEYGYARALLERAGHRVEIFDAQLDGDSLEALAVRVEAFGPHFTVICTAPSYLFWRCAPPELRVPRATLRALSNVGGLFVAIGPHASTSPKTVLSKLQVDAVILGEPEEILVRLVETPRASWRDLPSVGSLWNGEVYIDPRRHASDVAALPALSWSSETLERHRHHHHRFDREPTGPGAELEASRGCPYACTFCAKDEFRNGYRRRPRETVLEELDGLIDAGTTYVYFVDEIFLPDRTLLEALVVRGIEFGVQLRIDNWTPEMLELLGRAGCVSIEAGIESLTDRGRTMLAKRCKLGTDELSGRLVHAKRHVPFVQANLIATPADDPGLVQAWRARMQHAGVWANEPVPMFPYPGSPAYAARWGKPDDEAWERAHAAYLSEAGAFSDIQSADPRPLAELEAQ